MRALEKFEIRKKALSSLRLLKGIQTYEKLSRGLGISIPVLARYVAGKNLPNLKRAMSIISYFEKNFKLEGFLEKRLKFDRSGLADMTGLITDPVFLSMVALWVRRRVKGKFDRVLSVVADGITLGYEISKELGVKFSYLKQKKESGVRSFYESTFLVRPTASSFTFYIPRRWIGRGEKILFVDDVLRSGSTLLCANEVIKNARAKLYAVFVLLASKDGLKKVRKIIRCPIYFLRSF